MGTGDTLKLARALKLPDTVVPVVVQALGYPAESYEAGGQTRKLPFESLFYEMEYGLPFVEDPAVTEELRAEKLIQQEAPLPWRDAELAFVTRALGLEERVAFRGTRPAVGAGGGD
jgi:hypothetical protein